MTPVINAAEIERLARAVEPAGPWDYYLEQGYEGHGVVVTYTEDSGGARTLGKPVFNRLVADEAVKEYVASANPQTILTLLAALREARGALEDSCQCDYDQFHDTKLECRGCQTLRSIAAKVEGL